MILHGEHSVVYGKAALAVSIDLRTKVVVTRRRRRREAGDTEPQVRTGHLFPTLIQKKV